MSKRLEREIKILVVDDEVDILSLFKDFLEENSFKALCTDKPDEALKIVEESSIDLVIADLKMPEMDGIMLTKEILKINSNIPVIIMTGYASIESAVESIKAGASDFITKPFKFNHTLFVINKTLETKRLTKLAKKSNYYMKLSNIDELTRIYNLRYFKKYFQEQIKEHAVMNNMLSFMMADIDDFKNVNDKYGHLTGDLVLKNISNILKKSVRTCDFLARYAKKVCDFKKIAIFYEVNDYAMGLKDAFVRQAKKLGLRVIGAEAYMAETIDFKAQLTKFKIMRPDAIFIPGYAPQATLLISQARSLGIKCAFFGADGLDDEIMLKNPDADGLFVTTPFLVDRGGVMVKDFVERYRQKFSIEPNWFAANTYDAVGLAAAAITAAGLDREKVRTYLVAISSKEKAYQGVTGATYFDENGDCLKAAFVKVVKNGQWVSAKEQLQ